MAKQKHTRGAFVMIPLADGSFGYGTLLEAPYAAFYNTEPRARIPIWTGLRRNPSSSGSLSAICLWMRGHSLG